MLMLSPSTVSRRAVVVLATCGVVIIASCSSDDGLGQRYPVSGMVTYNGNPLEKGAISFVPEDPKGIGATGIIENGSYALSTRGENDGARPGQYKVTITAKEDATARAKAEFEKARAARKQASGSDDLAVVPRQFMVKAEAEAKSLIPPGYGDVRSTNLTAEVKEKSNTFDFKLTDAEAPAPPKAQPQGRGHRGR